MELERRLAHHVHVAEQQRLVIFTVPKVASTELIQLVRRMAGHSDWRDDPHYLERSFLGSRPPAEAVAILEDARWLKTAVLRDPAERLLSAYLNKFKQERSYAAKLFRPDGFGMPFDEFLGYVLNPNEDPSLPFGLHLGSDPHWRPQALVGELGRWRERLSMVADFRDIAEWCRSVLEIVDGWDEFGASGWGPEHGALFAINGSKRRTAAAERMHEFYDEASLEAVYAAYAIDLELGRYFGLDLRHY